MQSGHILGHSENIYILPEKKKRAAQQQKKLKYSRMVRTQLLLNTDISAWVYVTYIVSVLYSL
jgi:hypothetical protein